MLCGLVQSNSEPFAGEWLVKSKDPSQRLSHCGSNQGIPSANSRHAVVKNAEVLRLRRGFAMRSRSSLDCITTLARRE